MPVIAFLLFFESVLGFLSLANAQPPSVPQAGDLAIVQITTVDPDYVAFIVLKNHCDLRGLRYTDNGFLGNDEFRTTEGTGALPNHAGWSDVPINTIVELSTTTIAADNNYSDGFLGSPFLPIKGMPSFAQDGDQFFLYSGDGITTNVICGIHTYGNEWDSVCTSSRSSLRPPEQGNFIAIGSETTGKSVRNAYFHADAPITNNLSKVKQLLTNRAYWKSASARPGNRSFTSIKVETGQITPTPTPVPTPTLTPTPEILSSQNWPNYE